MGSTEQLSKCVLKAKRPSLKFKPPEKISSKSCLLNGNKVFVGVWMTVKHACVDPSVPHVWSIVMLRIWTSLEYFVAWPVSLHHAFPCSCCVEKLVKSMELTEAPLEMLELQFAVPLASIARLHLKSSNTETIHKMCIVRRNSLLLRNAISFFKKSS